MHTDSDSEIDSGDSPLSPDGRLRLREDPMVWIRKNPTRLLSVRRLELDYSGRGGEGIIGDSIGKLTELTHLSIEEVKTITCLPNMLTILRNLQMLHLRNCDKLQELPPNLGDLESLTSLSVSHCRSLKALPHSLANLSKLTNLDISCCDGLKELPANFGELESLMQFTLASCSSIKSLPDTFAKLSKLTKLNISGCSNLEELPANMGELESLTHFELENCRIKSLPSSVAKLSKLTTLDIEDCYDLKELPSNFGDLESLTHFQLDNCERIKSLPSSVAKLNKLTTLNIKYCDYLEELPTNIGNLESLAHFKLEECSSIKSLPSSVAMLSKLTTLNIGGFDLKELPANFGELENLTHFTLYSCSSIKSLPDSVANLSKLTTLNIHYCDNLQDLPANLGKLKSLTHLCIEKCGSLKECPSNLNVVDLSLIDCCSIQSLLRGLSNLDSLNLSLCSNTGKERVVNLKYIASLCHLKFQECSLCRSYVKELPENLDKLPQLSVLDIQETRIKCLPSSITKLSKLRLLLLPRDFILETLPYHFDESIVITVKDKHVRKTWKELREEMEIFSFTTVTGSPSGYLRLTGDPRPWIQNNYDLLSDVRILDWELGNYCTKNIRDSIAKLAELTHLYISGGYLSLLCLRFSRITHISIYDCEFKCGLKSFFDGLGKLSTLKYFHLDNLYGTTLPEHMDLPVSLKHLSLRFGGITFMPLLDSMTKLSNLKALHLSQGIQFYSLPRNLDIEKLKLVDCDMTNIKSLPRGLRHVEILHTKRMCNSKCDELEMCLNQFVDVETLSVTCHRIKLLPSLAGLHNLQELQLKDCFSIKKLPLNLDKMVNLVTLNISGTRVKSLPCSISNLPKLQRLILPKCFQRENLPLEFRDRSVFDDTDDKYYKDTGYYFYDHETSSEDDDNTTNTIEGVNKVVSEESEDGIISQQQISPHQLLNQPDPTQVLGNSHVSEANHPIGENRHHTFFSNQNQETEILPFKSEQLTDDNRLLNSQNPCFRSSQHALQPEHMDSMTSEIEHGLSLNFQHDFSRGTGSNLLVSENGQDEDNKHSEDYNFDGRDNNPINKNSLHSIYHSRKQQEIFHFGESSKYDLQNVQMPETMSCIIEEVLNDTEEGIIAEQQTSFRQLLNLPDALSASNTSGRNDLIGENSHHAIGHSQNQEMKLLSSGVCDEMITDLGSNFHNTVIFRKNSQHAVQDRQMNIRNSGTEHAIRFFGQDISSHEERDVSHNGNNLNAFENKKIEINSEIQGKKDKRKRHEITWGEIQSLFGMKEKDAAAVLGVQLSTLKRRCRELGIKIWPSSRMSRRNKRKASSKSSSKSEYSQHVECLDGVNQHVLSNHVPDPVPSGHNVVDNSTLVETQQHRDSDQPVQQHLDGTSTNLGTSSTIVQPNECSRTIVVKAKHNEDVVRFNISLSTNIDQLKEEIRKRLDLENGKFKIKYQDDEEEWMLLTCISDLKNAMRLSKSSNYYVVSLSVITKT